MNNIIKTSKKLYRDVRDPIYRLFRLKEIDFLNQYIDKETSIFSMNCFGGKIYQDLHRKYTSPTAGLFFTAEDFNKILRDINVIRNTLIFTPPSIRQLPTRLLECRGQTFIYIFFIIKAKKRLEVNGKIE